MANCGASQLRLLHRVFQSQVKLWSMGRWGVPLARLAAEAAPEAVPEAVPEAAAPPEVAPEAPPDVAVETAPEDTPVQDEPGLEGLALICFDARLLAPRRYGKTAFDVTLLVLEDDGAVLTGSLAAASLALADAKVEMRDLIAGATVHLKPRDASAAGGEELLLDCDRAEELAMPEKSAVLHLGLCPARGLVCLLHSVGPLPPKPFEQMVLLAKDTAEAFGAEMRSALLRRDPGGAFRGDPAMRGRLAGLSRLGWHVRSRGPALALAPALQIPTLQGGLDAQRRGMKLTPRELDHLRLSQAGQLAQRRLARGLRLNHPEAVALLTSQMMEFIRDGESVAALMDLGKQLLGRRQVLPGVEKLIPDVQVEATFPDGTKLLTVHQPICNVDGDLSLALKGSFLPEPDYGLFGELEEDEAPGKVTAAEGGVELNAGRSLIELEVTNTGDRPIQVGSHYHFIETNKSLLFDREKAYGRRLNVPSGSAVRFEPGDSKVVSLVEIAGKKRVVSGNRLVDGVASADRLPEVMARVESGGFGHQAVSEAPAGQPLILARDRYAELFGPTVGDKAAWLDYVDLLVMASVWDGKLMETWDAMVEMKKMGLVRSLGIRDFDVHHLEAFQSHGRDLPEVLQLDLDPFNLPERQELLQWCKARQIQIQATGSLSSLEEATVSLAPMSSNKNKSVAQLLLRWGFQMGFQLIPKSSKKEHIEENFQIFDFELTKKEMTFISQLEARPLNRSQLDAFPSCPLHAPFGQDFTVYGEECKFGGGKDIGIKGNRIVGIGKAGNPDIMDGVSKGMVVGVTTEAIAGEGMIVTAGGLDMHVHWICPQQIDDAIASGLTTMYGGGTGPATGTNATTCTPAPSQVAMMLQATDTYPLNFGFSGKGNTSDPTGLKEVIKAGAAGLKLHEDWGTTPADTINESGFVDDSIAAMKGRTIHTYHTEGAGGGHAPDIIKVCGLPNVLPSSTNPTRPFTTNTMEEHLDMLMVCHHLNKNIPEDVAFAESRIRGETIAAEETRAWELVGACAISIISSDSQAMGRVGEVICRTWQTAAKMKLQRGPLPEDTANDNTRIKRYIAKYTINPALAHGMAHAIGSLEVGKLADICLWQPAFFGSKPEMVIKGGTIAWAQMGDPNASIPTPQPVLMRPMFGSFGKAVGSTCLSFVSKDAAEEPALVRSYGLHKQIEAVKGTRSVQKKERAGSLGGQNAPMEDMVLNDATPTISVNPETFEVTADGEKLTCEPVDSVPLARKYFLF
eukprot:g21085.t2